jgi:hypothetical protein
MERFRVEPKEVDIRALVDRICGKSKLGRPMKIGRGRAGGGKEDRRSGTECEPRKGIGIRTGPVADHTDDGVRRAPGGWAGGG